MTADTEKKLPFMVAALLALGAWLACLTALFLIGRTNFLWTGAVFTALAAWFGYMAGQKSGKLGAFLEQAALAFSLCGKALLIFGLAVLWSLTAGQVCWLVWGMTALSYPFFTQKMDRAVMSFASVLVLQVWVFQHRAVMGPYMESLSVLLFVSAYVLFLAPNEKLRPLAWGILPGCAAGFVFSLIGQEDFFISLNPLFLAVCLCVVYAWRAREKCQVGAVALILLLSYLTNTGTVMGIALLALGFVQKRLSMKIVGAAVFALSLVWLYYQMKTTLLVKAYYLWASGLILLAVYGWQKRGMYAS